MIAGEMTFGMLNGHAVGIIMKELVRRAIKAIRRERITFEVTEKASAYKDYDIVTSADKAAQKIYLKSLQECFPDFGIVAEEDGFRKPCLRKEDNVYFSVDPLDGTKAFGRRQSHGVGTQIALLAGDDVISAYVGDVMTQEVYGFRPGSESVWRINEYDVFEKLEIEPYRQLADQYLLMRDNPAKFPPFMQRMYTYSLGRLFKDIDIEGGSIGLSFARLWKGEVGGIIMAPYAETPWDAWPTVGISLRMGFAFFRLNPNSNTWQRYTPELAIQIQNEKEVRLVIHQSRVNEFDNWEKS